ncbi:MAG: hypothetical protein ABFS35_20630 [Bacteroidota bacterium]
MKKLISIYILFQISAMTFGQISVMDSLVSKANNGNADAMYLIAINYFRGDHNCPEK